MLLAQVKSRSHELSMVWRRGVSGNLKISLSLSPTLHPSVYPSIHPPIIYYAIIYFLIECGETDIKRQAGKPELG